MSTDRLLLFSLFILFASKESVQQDAKCFDNTVFFPENSNEIFHTRLLSGDFIFPDVVFNCSGTITSITMAVHFIVGYNYSPSLSLNITLWGINGSRLEHSVERDVMLALELNTADYHLMQNGDGTFSTLSSVGATSAVSYDVNIDVKEGEILGFALPDGSSSLVNGITVGVDTNHTSSPVAIGNSVISGTECWRTDGSVATCTYNYRIAGYGRPFVMMQIMPDPATTDPTTTTVSGAQTGPQFNATAATAIAIVFGVFLLFAVVVIFVLIVVIVCRKKKLQTEKRSHVDRVALQAAPQQRQQQQQQQQRQPQVHMSEVRDVPNVSYAEPEGYTTMNSVGSATIDGLGYAHPAPRNTNVGDYEYASLTGSRQMNIPHNVVPTEPNCYQETHPYNHMSRESHNQMGDNEYVTTSPPPGYNELAHNAQYLNSHSSTVKPTF